MVINTSPPLLQYFAVDNQEAVEINREGQRRCEEDYENRDGDWDMDRARDRAEDRDRDRARDEERDRNGDSDEERHICHQCDGPLSDNGELLHHIRNRAECLLRYTRRQLPKKDSGMYSRKSGLAIFHLAVRFNLCCNPGCPHNMLSSRGLVLHLKNNSECLGFYQREGSRLLQWEENLSSAGVGRNVGNCRKHLKRDLKIEEELGPHSYNQEQSSILNKICDLCLLQGPLPGKNSHDIEDFIGVTTEGLPIFHCKSCQQGNTERPELLQQRLKQMGEALGGEETHRDKVRKIDDTMTPIIIQSQERGGRIVFVPSVLAAGQTRAPEDQVSVSTTVLVPFHEDAIDEIGKKVFDRAYSDKGELKSLVELFSKQGLRTFITTGISVVWRTILSDVQTNRLNTWNVMGQGKGKGEVLERNPTKKAKVTQEKQLWSLTERNCFQKTLPWSHASINQKDDERRSTSCINGQVKTFINFSVLDGFRNTYGELPAIIARAARKFVKVRQLNTEKGALPKFSYEVLCENGCNPDDCEEIENHGSEQFLSGCEEETNLTLTGSIVVNYVWAKLKQIEKHHIRPEYTDYDIILKWDKRRWAAECEGYLYNEEYDEVNKAVARGEVTEEERAEVVMKYPATLPTVSLDPKHLMDIHELSEARAGDVVMLAQKHQNTSITSEPPSLLTIWTGKGVEASKEEDSLREQLIEEAERLPKDTSFVNSTLLITRKMKKQLRIISVVDEKLQEIDSNVIRLFDSISEEDRRGLGLYHLLLWKTAGKDKWTYRRGRKELKMVPYLPKLMEFTKMKMEVTTVLGGGGVMLTSQPKIPLDPSLASIVSEEESWKEISILEFMNSVSPQKVTDIKSQIHVDVKARNSKVLSWRPEKATDKDAGEDTFKSFDRKLKMDKDFVRTDSSPRKLYEHRPASLQAMRYGQFACQYRKLDPSQNGYKTLYDQCNSNSQALGPDSDFPMVGVPGRTVPTGVILNNSVLMKLRDDKIALPVLPDGERNYVTDVLLFGEWDNSDEVAEQSADGDTPLKMEQRKSVRLELFPKMV